MVANFIFSQTDFIGKSSDYSLLLPMLLAISLLIIAGLSALLYHYIYKLRECRKHLVRYISENIDLKKHVPPSDRPHYLNSNEVTPEEFIQILHNMMKRMMFLSLFLLLMLPIGAQEKVDSVYEFRFVPANDMFYIPYRNNQAELSRLSVFVEKYREAILDGRMPLQIDGYANTAHAEAENLGVAYLRSSRVKSELILRNGLTEACFITRNHSGRGEFVLVRVQIPTAYSPKETLAETRTEAKTPEKEDTRTLVETTAESVREVSQTAATITAATTKVYPKDSYLFALRANLLRWATLTPDLGIEWRINRHFGVLVNGSWTSWSWDDKNRRYALWKLSPEVRYYIGNEKRGYLGAMYHLGEFNYKLGITGKQGDYQGGGITGGYQLELNRALSLDFHAGLGYTRAEQDKYQVIEGTRVRQGSGTKNYWGINQLGITLVWRIIK